MGKKEIVILFILLLVFNSIPFSKAISEYNLTYDDNGNLIQGFDKYYEYNGFNQIKLVRENNSTGDITAEYFYDYEGNRIKKIEVLDNGENQTTYYISENFVQIINSSGVYNETYYYDEQDLIAEKDYNGNINYYHPDHLGSTTLITNESGEVIEETSYLPYGELIGGGNSRYLFTGKEKDANTELYYYGARYYNPFFKHFIQPDNVLSNIYDPQQLNRYSYAENNPYKYTDPSGESPTLISGAVGYVIGYAAGAIYSAWTQYQNTGSINLLQVGITAGTWGLAGGVAGLTGGLAYAGLAPTTIGGSILAAGGAGTFGGAWGGEAGLITSGVLNNDIGRLADPVAHAEAVGYGGLTGGILGLAGGVVGAGISGGIGALRGGTSTIGTGRINEPGPFTTKLSDGTIREYGKFTPATNLGPTSGARGVKEMLTDGTKRFIYESYDKYGRVTQIHPKAPKDLGHFIIDPNTGKIIGWRP